MALLEVSQLAKRYRLRGGAGVVKAVDGVSLSIARGETLGLVGESGSGKTTVSRCLMRLVEPTEGSIRFDGGDVLALRGRGLAALRRRMQIVHQDPYSSLDPLMRIGRIIGLPLRLLRGMDRDTARARTAALLSEVGLSPHHAEAFPHELSGGQRQRVAIARALSLEPDLLIADEPVSALDVSVQAQVLNLLLRLQRERGLAMLFISHDIAVVDHMSDRVIVMQHGRIVEEGPTEQVVTRPQHDYTRMLLAARPRPPLRDG
jgi:ABC-type glutathione transport system ATPase component